MCYFPAPKKPIWYIRPALIVLSPTCSSVPSPLPVPESPTLVGKTCCSSDIDGTDPGNGGIMGAWFGVGPGRGF